jgi:hypothetical protein
MAAHGEKSWPSVGSFSGRPWGGSHGRCQFSHAIALVAFARWVPVADPATCEWRAFARHSDGKTGTMRRRLVAGQSIGGSWSASSG